MYASSRKDNPLELSGDTIHYAIQGFISAILVLVRYFWWLILIVFALRGLESILRWLGFDRSRKPKKVTRGRGRR